MNSYGKPIKTVTLAYFSGTGGTQAVADCFEKQLAEYKLQVNKINIAVNDSYAATTADLLIILSPVYAFRLSSIMENWTKKLPEAKGIYAAIISVSGGGEISPNTACRINCKRFLKRHGYDLIYEKMIMMPSNFAIQAEKQMNFDLLHALSQKVDTIISDIMSGNKLILEPKLQDRLFSILGKAEHFGARIFGLSIHASKNCNQCGKCIRNCPRKNIKMKNGRPKFGFRCIWCMKCIYSCPCKALSPRILKFTVLKSGFDINQMIENGGKIVDNSKRNYSKDGLWQGANDYLQK
jgi:ferredoxin